MKCEYCGTSLKTLDATCPNCGRLMNKEQLAIRKEMNGINNPYINRLNDLNKESLQYKLSKKEDNNKVKAAIFIIIILLVILLIALLKYLSS